MRPDLTSLYAELDPSSADRLGLESTRAPVLEGVPGATADHAPLLPEQVGQLRRLYQADPDAVREFLGGELSERVSHEQAQRMIEQLERTLAEPAAAGPELEALFSRRTHRDPPAGFSFDLYDPGTIPINVNRKDFQDSDWVGYALGGGLNGALHHANLLPLGPIRRHQDFASEFTYRLADGPSDVRIALFADFANGYYHARYIARRIEHNRYPYGVHLGDVYYAGTDAQVKAFLEAPLKGALVNTELFLLAGNHEMYARGRPWLAYLDRKRRSPETPEARAAQRQEGTYFRLVHDRFQLVGIDTEWFGHMSYPDPGLWAWLEGALREGRQRGMVNILLSANEPYRLGRANPTQLYRDLEGIVRARLLDLWFWGNTHYAALFERSDRFPFVGSCIGHGGFPYGVVRGGSREPVPARFVEEGTRFGGGPWEDPRPDMGNNGFCELGLNADGTVSLTYLDWRGRNRHQARLGRKDGVVDFIDR
jgi:hypothetical protein